MEGGRRLTLVDASLPALPEFFPLYEMPALDRYCKTERSLSPLSL